jgi:hypothetical protein
MRKPNRRAVHTVGHPAGLRTHCKEPWAPRMLRTVPRSCARDSRSAVTAVPLAPQAAWKLERKPAVAGRTVPAVPAAYAFQISLLAAQRC